MKNELSLCERAYLHLCAAVRRFALPLASFFAVGFLAHMYAFTNKLLNADETAALFSKGATVTSGRWGLEAVKLIFPDVSMPWIYGVISLALIAAAVCFVICMFDIKRPLTQALLAGAFAAFPALTGNFCYMFTSSAYALAILGTVAAVYLFHRGGWRRGLAGAVLLAFSLGIYQAYISLAASLCVLLLIKRLMREECTARDTLIRGAVYLGWLIGSLAAYYIVTLIVEAAMASGYQSYSVTSGLAPLRSLITAYTSFAGIFLSGNFGYVNSGLSCVLHLLCAAAAVGVTAASILRRHDAKKTALAAVLLAVYPLSVNCMYLIASVDIIHSLVVFSFVSFYVFAAMALEAVPAEWGSGARRAVKGLVPAALALIIACNVYFANKVYLKMYLEYENAYAFYNTLMAQVMDTPGFGRYTVIDLVGNTSDGVTRFDNIDTSGFTGPNEELVNTYTRVSFIKYYLGLDLYMYREDTVYDAAWYDEMPCYPAPGSIRLLEDEGRIIVKLS